jgi:predicted porin
MDLGKYARVMATVNPGWLYQDEAFLPYTANTAITGLAALPSSSLHGSKQTLAMNYTLIANPLNNVQLKAAYRHYDYHNHTASRDFTPVEGDTLGANAAATGQAAPGIVDNSPFGFEKKNLELTGQWFFAKRSSVKAGWEGEWFDRSHRDADSSFESSVFGAVDYSPKKDLLLRVAYRHQNRKPDVYQDEEASDAAGNPVPCTDTTTTFFTAEQRCHRRFDEAARLLDRVDTLVQYSYKQLTVSGGFQTLQSDYNRSGDTNSPTPLNFLTGAAATTGPYYLYGALKDIAFIYTGDASYAFSKAMSVFAEYTHELYHKRMISRSRTPTSGAQTILTCNGCDTPNNDWESTYRDVFDTFALGTDLFLGKKVYFTTYYSLSAGKGNVISRALGDPTIVPGQNCPAAPAPCPNQFTLTGTSAAQNYPETTTRIHEVSAVFKYKLTKNIMPRVEYRYQQFDNRDYQTTAMTPYMGCIGTTTMNPALAPPCPAVGANVAVQSPSQFYPFFVVGDTASARYLFMGVDQPSYGVHSITATVEYRF